MTFDKVTLALLVAGSAISGAMLHSAFAPTPTPPVVVKPVVTSAAEVSDLLAQLRTVTKNDYDWTTYVHFTLKTVKIKISAKNGDEHEVTAPTLAGAIRQLVAPNGDVSAALKEWQTAHPGQEGL